MSALCNAILSPPSLTDPIKLILPVGISFPEVLLAFSFLFPVPVIINSAMIVSLNQINFYFDSVNQLFSIRM